VQAVEEVEDAASAAPARWLDHGGTV
jgi:hypothetical protein